jgi:hypothetical protein
MKTVEDYTQEFLCEDPAIRDRAHRVLARFGRDYDFIAPLPDKKKVEEMPHDRNKEDNRTEAEKAKARHPSANDSAKKADREAA